MKWLLGISIVVSISLNIYFIYDNVMIARNQELTQSINKSMGMPLTKTQWDQGLKIFQTKLRKENKALLARKYYYINIWTSWCKPCIKEMPWLDSIAGNLNKDVGYVFLTDLNDQVVKNVLTRKNYHLKNFVLLNDMNDFVSAICNERKIRSKIYPMVLILSNKGELLHYSTGAYENSREASSFADLINKLE
jgi:thiol-disulfide isomerase/thioredoxin